MRESVFSQTILPLIFWYQIIELKSQIVCYFPQLTVIHIQQVNECAVCHKVFQLLLTELNILIKIKGTTSECVLYIYLIKNTESVRKSFFCEILTLSHIMYEIRKSIAANQWHKKYVLVFHVFYIFFNVFLKFFFLKLMRSLMYVS